MNIMRMMAIGAHRISDLGLDHTAAHAAAGFSPEEWDLLTCRTPWSQEERRQVKSVLSEAVNITMTLAGLPAEPLPGQYVAAVIATLVAPCNRLVAAQRAPETYDAVSASGLVESAEVLPMPPTQMVALVMAYSSGQIDDLRPRWNDLFQDEVLRTDAEQ